MPTNRIIAASELSDVMPQAQSGRMPHGASAPAIAGRSNTNFSVFSLAVSVTLLPLGAFAWRLQWLPAASVIAGLGLAAWLAVRAASVGSVLSAPIAWRDLGACLGAALALCLLGGQGHLFYSTWDWMARDAVLADLVGQGGMPHYRIGGQDYVLRAPIGMYLLPALVGRVAGLAAAHYAMAAQNALLLGSILYLASRLVSGRVVAVMAALVFFSPLDIIPRVVIDATEARETGKFVLSPLTMFWNAMVPVWGNIPSLFWAPNHALPGWLFALSFLFFLRSELSLAQLGLIFVASLLWSPLPMIGAVPFMAYAIWMTLRVRRASREEYLGLCAIACLAPLAIYLQMDAGALSREWMVGSARFWGWYGLMLMFGIPHAWLLLADREAVPTWQRPAITLAVVTLMVFTLYRFGAQAGDNDMALRATIVPMFLLGFAFADHLAAFNVRGGLISVLATGCLVIGAMTGAMEIRRALADPAWRVNDCNILTAMEKASPGFVPINYIARLDRVPAWLVVDEGRRAQHERRLCWPGYPLAKE